jgi:uncharacterized membrane protein YhaH (DUF805 family)
LTLYWILGTFSNEVETSSRAGGVFRAFEVSGQAISYGLSSSSSIGAVISLYVNIAVLALSVPSMALLIRRVPEAVTEGHVCNEDTGVLEHSEKHC